LWRNLFGVEPRGVFIIIDEMVGAPDSRPEHAQLRALPMILELGITKFTFVDTWFHYKLVNFDYLKFGAQLLDVGESPLCQFISQDVELQSDLEITKHLLNKALANQGSVLILVLDSTKFCLKDNQDGKPMIEDWDLTSLAFRYEEIFPRYLKLVGINDPPIPLTETQNMVFHRMAKLQLDVLGERPRRLSELFEYEVIPSQSYAWEILKTFATRRAQMEFHPYIHQCLRSWIEKDITRIAEQMLVVLQRCQFDPRKVERLRVDRGKKEKKRP